MKLKIFLSLVLLAGVFTSCKEQLDVKNPNQPTLQTLETEKGMTKFAMGGIYINGFVDLKYQDGVVGLFWGNGYHDLMADNVGAEAANVYMNQVGCPQSVTLDNATVVNNPNAPNTQVGLLRQVNINSNAGQVVQYYEWAYMYALNKSANFILTTVDKVTFTGDQATKVALLKAWAYWWKGYAYSRIGSMYYGGVIVDDPNLTNGNYVSNTDILAEAEKNFAACEGILNSISQNADYNDLFGAIIPEFCQVGKGGVLSPAEWKKSINTMRARNLLANKRVSAMTNGDWNQVLAFANAGIGANDHVFTLRSNANADILSPLSGALSAKSTGDPKNAATYKISERLIQAFKGGENSTDKRFTNNFQQNSVWVGNVDRGNAFNTRWQLLDGGNGNGAYVYSDRSPGGYELFMAGSYEENELMKAEANIYLGNTDTGVASIDAVRTAMGAGWTSGAGLTKAQAIAELRSERRVGLLFRSVAFYDARRYGVIDDVSKGGGVTGAILYDNTGTRNTNVTINYNFMDYWDVPDNELVYNKPVAGTEQWIKNPNF